MPMLVKLYKAFFNPQNILNHYYSSIAIGLKYQNENAQRVGELLVVGLVDVYTLFVEHELARENFLRRTQVLGMYEDLHKRFPIQDMLEKVVGVLLG